MRSSLAAIILLVVIGFGGWYLVQDRPSIPGKFCNNGVLSRKQPVQSHRSYCLETQYNAPVYTFRVIDDRGIVVKNFVEAHEKLMHLIVVSDDLVEFQHLHPDFEANTGIFTISELMLSTKGWYHLFADFTTEDATLAPDGSRLPVAVRSPLFSTNSKPRPVARWKSPMYSAREGDYEVTLKPDSRLTSGTDLRLDFEIKKKGKLITNLDPYLGSLGHLVIIRRSFLDYLHNHPEQQPTDPQTGSIGFGVHFPFGGDYDLFLQFQHEGKIITTHFGAPVIGAAIKAPMGDNQMH